MRKFLKILLYICAILLIISIATITTVSPKPAKEQSHYDKMMLGIDSIGQLIDIPEKSAFVVGTAKVSITPDSVMALAGYGARKPKEFDEIMDSIFVRTMVIQSEFAKAAIITADLLIIHPDITKELSKKLTETKWNLGEIYLSATHSHSSIGQWAPGLVGGLFAGSHDPTVAGKIADRIIQSLKLAETNADTASFSYSISSESDLVLNRLVGEKGIEDPFLKTIQFSKDDKKTYFSAFSAHATCLTSQSRNLSGDFPSYFHKELRKDSMVSFSQFAAGPVASMGPETPISDQFGRTRYLGEELAQRIIANTNEEDSISITSFSIPLELGEPQFKISKNLILRPYLFEYAFGNEPAQINGLLLNDVLLIGTPCDFSGELAVPLYDYAKDRGLELIITSFNGGYIGYITKDEWFDLEKYETRTMNWYGSGNGEYFTDIIKKLIDIVDANN